jgi:hypothetical protein
VTRSNSAWIVALVSAAVLGLTIFTALAWRSVSVERADATDAVRRFEDVRRDFRSTQPLVRRDQNRGLVRNAPATARGAAPVQLRVLVYRASEERLIQADVPLWFFRVKGPAVDYALRGTGFDLASLGLTAGDLEHAGAGLVVDEARTNGDRLLAWTE